MTAAPERQLSDLPPTALIADDEAPLRAYLRSLLAEVWPELKICAEAANGPEALAAIRRHGPRVAFLDIRMPGLTGLEVAAGLEVADACHLVFVTAYEDYAVEAFERRAVDYLLKPVIRERLTETVTRLREKIDRGTAPAVQAADLARTLLQTLKTETSPSHLQWLRVQRKDGLALVPVAQVVYFQAQDKYTAVQTGTRTHLVRTSIRDLAAQLDPEQFWQIHRGTIVNVAQIQRVDRSLTGRGVIRLKDRPETLTVSRAYLHLFKQM